MPGTFFWNDGWLRRAVVAAHFDAARDVALVANRLAPWRHLRGSVSATPSGPSSSVLRSSDPLAPIAEGGSRPHTIAPHGSVLHLADGRFVTGPVDHPGTDAHPFLSPAARTYPLAYRRRAAARLPRP